MWEEVEQEASSNTALAVYIPLPSDVCAALRTSCEEAVTRSGNSILEIDLRDMNYHVTLFMSAFPTHNINNILDIVQRLTPLHQTLHLRGHGISVNGSGKMLFLDIVRGEDLMTRHNMIVEALAPLREGFCMPGFKEADWLPPKNSVYLARYGFPWVLDEYQPHVTLMVGKSTLDADHYREHVEVPIEFEAPALCVGALGSFGTIRETIASFGIRGETSAGS